LLTEFLLRFLIHIFNIDSMGSKYHGESEKLMKALFAVARQRQPCFIWIDEIDSMLGSRSEGEHEASRRLKTEFLVQFDGAMASQDDAVYVMAATNRPQDLDTAVLRRLNKRIYVPLPNTADRYELLHKLTLGSTDKALEWSFTSAELRSIAVATTNLSGADLHAMCREAALMPLRDLGPSRIADVDAKNIRPVTIRDLQTARFCVKPSTSRSELEALDRWDLMFGSISRSRSNSSVSRPEKVKVKRWRL
jgi:spastin